MPLPTTIRRLSALALVLAAGCATPRQWDVADAGANDRRYCEILVGKVNGDRISIDVWNTWKLNECPGEEWWALDSRAIKREFGADLVVMNGPRWWLVDGFEGSRNLDPTPRTFGTLQLRKAGVLEMPLAEARASRKPYATRSVRRDTTWKFDAGNPVFELVDPNGRIFVMQSYTVLKGPQTKASLAQLGEKLSLPLGWKFRTRVLAEDLRVTAVDGVATIVQDELENTYQLSQQ